VEEGRRTWRWGDGVVYVDPREYPGDHLKVVVAYRCIAGGTCKEEDPIGL